MKIDYKTIGTRIKKKRESLDWTQEYLAELVECSNKHICNIENGNTIPSIKTFIKISNALESSLDELLCDYVHKASAYLRDDISVLLNEASHSQTKLISNVVSTILDELRRMDSK